MSFLPLTKRYAFSFLFDSLFLFFRNLCSINPATSFGLFKSINDAPFSLIFLSLTTAIRLSSFEQSNFLLLPSLITSIFWYLSVLYPSAIIKSTSSIYLSLISSSLYRPFISVINASLLSDTATIAFAPAFLCFHVSFPSLSISKPCAQCFIVAILYPFFVKKGITFSISVVFPLLDFPTIEIIGIIVASLPLKLQN